MTLTLSGVALDGASRRTFKAFESEITRKIF
jgi:hypothetical protein